MTAKPLPVAPLPFKRLLSRAQAAYYIDMGTSKFDQLVTDGRMPKPLRIDSRLVWDVRQLDSAIDALHDADSELNSWSDL
ncbi:hypothetical protein D3P06_01490 [Paracoccus aestuarii]|uniref:Uncharacterized protein n=1 Tax=Paracoccus aestuarii TaxID=453842 RepID=A0A419A2D0_9RHOB|nr:hypothetical protein [Paracoccus aestuarii]RJL07150.1 hypothetical protein D3P06_01490 [Paracoccus aestuarii]WCQ99560.1 hypothetical protein JHW48_02090 [Paracoccus aestuarii]